MAPSLFSFLPQASHPLKGEDRIQGPGEPGMKPSSSPPLQGEGQGGDGKPQKRSGRQLTFSNFEDGAPHTGHLSGADFSWVWPHTRHT